MLEERTNIVYRWRLYLLAAECARYLSTDPKQAFAK
jgi:hypothetical protein